VPELQILICYNRPEDAVATYRQRWQIETCFRAMKSSGFNIEDTHLRDIDRIARLTAMVCMALVVWFGRNRKCSPQTSLQAEI